jgi:hypothetical protein
VAAQPIYPLRLEPAQRARLEELAVQHGVYMAQIIKRLLMHPQALELLGGRRRKHKAVK